MYLFKLVTHLFTFRYYFLGDLISSAVGFLGVKKSNEASITNTNATNAANAKQAADAQAFNEKEAKLNREFQQYNANTAHQRAVDDLRAAGLNPILAANQGAPSPSGSTASGVQATMQSPNEDYTGLGGLVNDFFTRQQTKANTKKSKADARTANAQADIQEGMAKIYKENPSFLKGKAMTDAGMSGPFNSISAGGSAVDAYRNSKMYKALESFGSRIGKKVSQGNIKHQPKIHKLPPIYYEKKKN